MLTLDLLFNLETSLDLLWNVVRENVARGWDCRLA